MRTIRQLDETEIRVLGTLLEKERTTPDYYPMTVNALLAACNQKSNREPVTSLSETEVVESLDRLRRDVLAWRSDGARAERWSQSISRRLELDPESRALLTLLMLRGPQTPGELRGRSGRLYDFRDLAEVEATLARMAEGDTPLAVVLPRQPGRKESRWAHLLGAETETDLPAAAEPQAVAGPPAPPAAPRPSLEQRLAAVEGRVEELAAELARLRGELEG